MFEEPVRAGGFIEAMGAEAQDLEDATDGSTGDEVGRVHGAFNMEAFAEIDGVFAAGCGDNLPGLRRGVRRW